MTAKHIFHFFLFFQLLLEVATSPALSPVHGSSDEYPPDVSPPWLKVGTFVEYEVFVYFVSDDSKSTLRWECMSLEDNIAVLNVSTQASATFPGSTPVTPHSALMRIKTDTREVMAENGSSLGKTYLWVPPFMKQDQEFWAEGTETNAIICTVISYGSTSIETQCQGFQEVMSISCEEPWYLDFCCDIDRGIFAMGDIPPPLIRSLGIGEYVDTASTIHDTNIDLGPVYLKSTVLTFLWRNLLWEILIILFAATLLLYRRRRRRRRARPDVMERLQRL
jgi:hypothetical protein